MLDRGHFNAPQRENRKTGYQQLRYIIIEHQILHAIGTRIDKMKRDKKNQMKHADHPYCYVESPPKTLQELDLDCRRAIELFQRRSNALLGTLTWISHPALERGTQQHQQTSKRKEASLRVNRFPRVFAGDMPRPILEGDIARKELQFVSPSQLRWSRTRSTTSDAVQISPWPF